MVILEIKIPTKDIAVSNCIQTRDIMRLKNIPKAMAVVLVHILKWSRNTIWMKKQEVNKN